MDANVSNIPQNQAQTSKGSTALKWLLRILSALFVLLSLYFILVPASLKINGIKRRDVKAAGEELNKVSDAFSDLLKTQPETVEQLIDYELFESKRDYRTYAAHLNTFLTHTLSCKASLWTLKDDLLFLSDSANRVSAFLEDNNTPIAFLPIDTVTVVQEAAPALRAISISYIALLCLIFLLGILNAALMVFGKEPWLKYVYAALLLLLVAALIALPILANRSLTDLFDALNEHYGIPYSELETWEDIRLSITAAPILAAVSSVIPWILMPMAKKKEKAAPANQ